jgi:hypothetical protein
LLCGVTVNVPVPDDGDTPAMPVHEFALPADGVLTVNEPLKPGSLAVNVCAAPLPVARNDSELGARASVPGDVVGVAVAPGVGVIAGATAVAVPPEPLHAAHHASIPTTTIASAGRARLPNRIGASSARGKPRAPVPTLRGRGDSRYGGTPP